MHDDIVLKAHFAMMKLEYRQIRSGMIFYVVIMLLVAACANNAIYNFSMYQQWSVWQVLAVNACLGMHAAVVLSYFRSKLASQREMCESIQAILKK